MDGHVQIHDPVVIAAQNGFKDTDPCPPTCFGRLSQCVFHKRTWHDGEMAGLEFISYAYVAPFVEEALRQLLLARPELMGSHVGSNGRITVYVYKYICVCMYIYICIIYIIQAWHQQVMGVCRLQKCEIEEANEANTLVWTRQTLVHGYTYDIIYISYCRYNWPMFATHKLFWGSDIPPLMIEHQPPNQTNMFPFKWSWKGGLKVSSTICLNGMYHQYLIASHNSEKPSRKDVHPITNSGLKIRGIS